MFLLTRTNSDSALHQSTLTPAQQAAFTGGSQELQPKRGTGPPGFPPGEKRLVKGWLSPFLPSSVLLLTVPGAGPIKQEVNGDRQNQSWELKKVSLRIGASSPAFPGGFEQL